MPVLVKKMIQHTRQAVQVSMGLSRVKVQLLDCTKEISTALVSTNH